MTRLKVYERIEKKESSINYWLGALAVLIVLILVFNLFIIADIRQLLVINGLLALVLIFVAFNVKRVYYSKDHFAK